MLETVDYRLARLGLELPRPALPPGAVLPWRRSGDLLLLSDQPSALRAGRLGRELDLEAGREAAREAALALLGHARLALGGDLGRVLRCLRVGVFVQAAPEFWEHAEVADAASAVFTDVLGEAGRHARSVAGAVALPYGAAVSVEAILRVG